MPRHTKWLKMLTGFQVTKTDRQDLLETSLFWVSFFFNIGNNMPCTHTRYPKPSVRGHTDMLALPGLGFLFPVYPYHGE